MKSMVGWKLVLVAGLTSQLCAPVLAQENESLLGSAQQTSHAVQTGTGMGSTRTAAKNGRADGTGNLQLGGERRPLYRLHRSDVLTLSFILSPEFDQKLTVQPDGYVFLKNAGPVLAQGLTLEELRVAVKVAYTGYLHDPQVAIALEEFEHPYFVAGGEVGHPGKYELRSDLTLMEAIQVAGGFTHEAKHSQVVLFRHVNDELFESHVFNLKKMLNEKKFGEVTLLQPGDLVFVPQNSLSKVERFLSKPSLSMYVSSTQF